MNNIKKKKIAVVISGHLRTYKNTFFNLKRNLLDLFDCDLFISTWNNPDHLQNKIYSDQDIRSFLFIYYPWIKDIKINESRHFFDTNQNNIDSYPCNYGVWSTEDYKLYRGGILTKDAINKLTSQWYAVSQGFNLIDNFEKYDYIIKIRFDIDLLRPFVFLDNDIVVGNANGVENYYNIRDYIVYVKPNAFNIMKNMYMLSIENFKKYSNFSAETMLEYTLRNNFLNLPLTIDNNLRCDIEYRLLK